jgi:hypothetical protein
MIKLSFSLTDLATVKLIEARFITLVTAKAKGQADKMDALFEQACSEFTLSAGDVSDIIDEMQRHNLRIGLDFVDPTKFKFARRDRLRCLPLLTTRIWV